MSHQTILHIFFDLCRIDKEHVDTWFPNGKNAVRVRFDDKREVIFTFYNIDNWSLETVDHFIGKMRKSR